MHFFANEEGIGYMTVTKHPQSSKYKGYLQHKLISKHNALIPIRIHGMETE